MKDNNDDVTKSGRLFHMNAATTRRPSPTVNGYVGGTMHVPTQVNTEYSKNL